jgi:glycosyltransferase involved in cell wall biosynthesis
MKISVIIPTCNAEATLERCLQSIISQDYKDFEVWLMDGASTDTTMEIIRVYAAKHAFIKFISAPDKGIYDAMNKGINLCSGDWIYFLGSDDTFYQSDVLSAIARELINCACNVLYGNVIMRGQNQWNLDNVVFNGEYDLEKMISTNINHQAIFYHKSVFQRHGNYNLEYTAAADHDFNLRCYAGEPFKYVELIIANFFLGGHSTITKDNKFMNDFSSNLYRYFKTRIFTKAFLSSRLYIRRGALSPTSTLSLNGRLICLLAYAKLKVQSVFLSNV